MAIPVALLESIPETRYLSAENYLTYRVIMRLFYQEYEKMHYQLDRDTVLELLQEYPQFAAYTPEQLTLDLNQLTRWKNLTAVQDPHKVYTVQDFHNKQFQYMITQPALEIERMTLVLENLSTRTTGLTGNVFRRLHQALQTAEHLSDMTPREVAGWWQDLEEDFQRLSRNHQDYLSQFYGSAAERQMRSPEFIAYKQKLIQYLEEFIQELQSSSSQIAVQLESFSPEQVQQILQLVYDCELEIPRPGTEDNPNWREDMKARNEGLWSALLAWFTGQDSIAAQILDVTNEVIRSVVQNAALLVQMRNMGVSNKTEIRHLLRLFSGCESLEEAHRLSAMVFGAQSVRHFVGFQDLETDRSDTSVYEVPSMERQLRPRARNFAPRVDRTGFADRSAERKLQRQHLLREQRILQDKVMSFVENGKLDFAHFQRPVPPEVRSVFLNWISLANLSENGISHTEYGQRYKIRKYRDTCQMLCTDGVLSMPHCVLIFID